MFQLFFSVVCLCSFSVCAHAMLQIVSPIPLILSAYLLSWKLYFVRFSISVSLWLDAEEVQYLSNASKVTLPLAKELSLSDRWNRYSHYVVHVLMQLEQQLRRWHTIYRANFDPQMVIHSASQLIRDVLHNRYVLLASPLSVFSGASTPAMPIDPEVEKLLPASGVCYFTVPPSLSSSSASSSSPNKLTATEWEELNVRASLVVAELARIPEYSSSSSSASASASMSSTESTNTESNTLATETLRGLILNDTAGMHRFADLNQYAIIETQALDYVEEFVHAAVGVEHVLHFLKYLYRSCVTSGMLPELERQRMRDR